MFSALGGYGLGSILIMLRMLVSMLPWLPFDDSLPQYVLMKLFQLCYMGKE